MNEQITLQFIAAHVSAADIVERLGIEPDTVSNAGDQVGEHVVPHTTVSLIGQGANMTQASAELAERINAGADAIVETIQWLGDDSVVRCFATGFGETQTSFMFEPVLLAALARVEVPLWVEGYLLGGEVYLLTTWTSDGQRGLTVAVASDRESARERALEIIGEDGVMQLQSTAEGEPIRSVGYVGADGVIRMLPPWET